MRTVLQPKQKMVCPHCGYMYDEAAEDFVIKGQVGDASASEERCPECDLWFYPYRSENGEIVV